MSKGPALFVDIGKRAKDLLNKDYPSDRKFTVSTYTGAGVISMAITIAENLPSTKTIASFKVHDYNSGKRRQGRQQKCIVYVHYLDNLKNATVGEISRKFPTNENTFSVGGAYAVDHLTLIKAKLNNHGRLGALLQHEVLPKSLLTVSGELRTKALDKSPCVGLALALKP